MMNKPYNFNAILKARTNTIIFGPSLRGISFFLFKLGGFYNDRDNYAGDWQDPLLLSLPLSALVHQGEICQYGGGGGR